MKQRSRVLMVMLILGVLVALGLGTAMAEKGGKPGKPPKPGDDPADPRIAFSSGKGRMPGVAVMNLDGSNRTQVFLGSRDNPGQIWSISWSPPITSDPNDMGSIAFTLNYNDTWRVDVILNDDGVPEGRDPHLLATDYFRPAWSPDGSEILVLPRMGTVACHGIFSMDPFSGYVDPVPVYLPPSCDDYVVYSAWSPDGTEIVVVGTNANGRFLQVVNRTTGEKSNLLESPPGIGSARWPDWGAGDFLAVDGICFLDLSSRFLLAGLYDPDWAPEGWCEGTISDGEMSSWSPDGTHLVFARGGIHIYDKSNDARETIYKGGRHPDWSPRPFE